MPVLLLHLRPPNTATFLPGGKYIPVTVDGGVPKTIERSDIRGERVTVTFADRAVVTVGTGPSTNGVIWVVSRNVEARDFVSGYY